MQFFKHFFQLVFLLALMLLLSSWGHLGHHKISYLASLSYNQEMAQFDQWTSALAAHASDADIRKGWDPTEGPKHYIDVDNYAEFTTTGVIPQTLDSAILIHGYSFVYDQGILPWATQTSFDSLQSCFERGDLENAVLFAADLGHYVADGHMPLHITRNYNGQYTGNYGIHSRYESDMISMFNSEIDYPGFQIEVVDNVNQYIFNYLYANYNYVDSILSADDYAQNIAGNNYSTQYFNALWERTENLTIKMYKKASHNFTELIYTAWKNAGSPGFSSVFSPSIKNIDLQINNSPNPFREKTKFTITIAKGLPVILEIIDVSGNPVTLLINEHKAAGEYQLDFDTHGLPAGIYYAVLRSQSSSSVHKIVKL